MSPKCLPNQWTTNQIKGTSIVRDYVHGQFELQLYQYTNFVVKRKNKNG